MPLPLDACAASPLSSTASTLASAAAHATTSCPRIRHILTGTFNTLFLHLLAYDTLTRSLSVALSLQARGPHQFLALGRVEALDSVAHALGTSHPDASDPLGVVEQRTVYATTWSESSREVSAWRVRWPRAAPLDATLHLVNTQPIPAAGSYVSVQPPPYDALTAPAYGVPAGARTRTRTRTRPQYLYQAGGPTGEVFALDEATGAIGDKKQQIVFLRGGEEALPDADKSRKSLRYGAHNVDFDVNGLGYVADLGRNAILVYARDAQTGTLTLLHEAPSPTPHDGPRHVVPSPCGRYVFSVTEHNSFVDAWRVVVGRARDDDEEGGRSEQPAAHLRHTQRVSLLPEGADPAHFRGDTVRLSPSGRWLFATTRGMHSGTRGWVKAWPLALEPEGAGAASEAQGAGQPIMTSDSDSASSPVTWRTPTSGGKANAWEWAPRYPLFAPRARASEPPRAPAAGSPSSCSSAEEAGSQDSAAEGESDLAVLTDDASGVVHVLQWDGRDIVEVASAELPPAAGKEEGEGGKERAERVQGASHAVWLS